MWSKVMKGIGFVSAAVFLTMFILSNLIGFTYSDTVSEWLVFTMLFFSGLGMMLGKEKISGGLFLALGLIIGFTNFF
ncbi:hypothetical protein ACGTN9_11225 [Halobacillus sp. MO56]